MKVDLTMRERKVIRKIATLQLGGLDMVLRGDMKEDITMWCIEGNITREQLNESVRKDIETYENLIINPHEFINLPDEDLSLVKHILHRYIKRPNLQRAKKSIWRKMVYLDIFHFNPN